ncbi:MAG TPA: hypothetical protein VH593_03235, partial [Ktedonobacteraceae bacterium]
KQPAGRKALSQSLLCILLVCLTVVFLVGCDSNYTLNGSTTNGNGHQGSTTSGGSGSTNSGSGSTNSGSGSNAPSLPISIKYFPIQGNAPAPVLVDAQGMTLYIYTADPVACSGSCAQQWPPLLSSSCTPTSTTNLSGILSVVSNTNGVQVEYQGYALYTSALDTAPGQFQLSTTGAGPGSSGWSVATDDLPLNSNNPTPTFITPTPGAWCGQ